LNKRLIKEFVSSIGQNPHDEGDFSENDTIGRKTYVKIIKDYAISYYPDHPVKEIKIFEIERFG